MRSQFYRPPKAIKMPQDRMTVHALPYFSGQFGHGDQAGLEPMGRSPGSPGNKSDVTDEQPCTNTTTETWSRGLHGIAP
jgi:hypothetical protein